MTQAAEQATEAQAAVDRLAQALNEHSTDADIDVVATLNTQQAQIRTVADMTAAVAQYVLERAVAEEREARG